MLLGTQTPPTICWTIRGRLVFVSRLFVPYVLKVASSSVYFTCSLNTFAGGQIVSRSCRHLLSWSKILSQKPEADAP